MAAEAATAPLPQRKPEDTPFQELLQDPEFRVTVERVAAEKKAALADPGPSWKEWWLGTGLKWYIGFGLLVLDALLVSEFVVLGFLWAILPAILGAAYLDFLLYQYLWYRPEETRHGRGSSRSPWIHPVRFGRWTPEATAVRSGATLPPDAPDPKEFL